MNEICKYADQMRRKIKSNFKYSHKRIQNHNNIINQKRPSLSMFHKLFETHNHSKNKENIYKTPLKFVPITYVTISKSNMQHNFEQ